MEITEAAFRVRVTGRVQGVAFRAWTRDEASRLGLTGWVRNESDGSVSAVICGSRDAVSVMLERMRKGPPAARVDDVAIQSFNVEDSPSGFRVER